MVRYKVPATVIVQEVLEELVLLDSEKGGYFELNPTAALMFRALERGDETRAILAELQPQFTVAPEQLREDLEALIDELLNYGLLKGCT